MSLLDDNLEKTCDWILLKDKLIECFDDIVISTEFKGIFNNDVDVNFQDIPETEYNDYLIKFRWEDYHGWSRSVIVYKGSGKPFNNYSDYVNLRFCIEESVRIDKPSQYKIMTLWDLINLPIEVLKNINTNNNNMKWRF